MNRREILKKLTILPLAGSVIPFDMVSGASKGSLVLGPNIYESIGVEPVINCVGTYTIIGGSALRPAVVSAMHNASVSGLFIQYDELAFGVGQRLADLTGAEWGIVTAGCAAALKHVTAGCISGGNPEKLIRIPDLTGLDKTEIIMRSRTSYDHAIRNIGVTLIPASSAEEVGRAIGPKTAMIFILAGNKDLPEIARMAKPMDIPVLVDAAAEDLTVPNVHLQQGATIVAYSGGKALCGPQCAGLALGRKDILMSAWQASSPHHGPGRDNKVGKEEMIGMLAAVEDWVKRDHIEKMNTWRSYLKFIAQKVSTIKGVSCSVQEPQGLSNHSPLLTISWNANELFIDGQEVAEELAATKPRIAVFNTLADDSGNTTLRLSSGQMQPGNDRVVADRIYEILNRKRSKPKAMGPAAVDIRGRWVVDIEFYSSKSRHTFYIEKQDGNWIEGAHKGDFSTGDLVGIVEGDNVKLSSAFRPVADSVPYIFSGIVKNDKMSGDIYLGEYLRAKFSAQRYELNTKRRPIKFPKGQPLAT